MRVPPFNWVLASTGTFAQLFGMNDETDQFNQIHLYSAPDSALFTASRTPHSAPQKNINFAFRTPGNQSLCGLISYEYCILTYSSFTYCGRMPHNQPFPN